MKSYLTFFAAIILFSISILVPSIHAQSYSKGDILFQTGLSLGLGGREGRASIPPISASFQYGFHDLISAGATLGIAGSKMYTGSSQYRYMYYIIALRGDFHPFNLPKFPDFPVKKIIDVYSGLLMGPCIVTYKGPENPIAGYDPIGSYFFWGLFIGARFYLKPAFGFYVEAGYGLGLLNFGLQFKF